MSVIQTYTGLAFDPLNPKPELVSIEDIAESLSKICRFNGHCTKFYSVAQHSLIVFAICCDMGCGLQTKRYALLHDAAEAYIGDVTRPVKKSLYVGMGDNGLRVPIADIENELLSVIMEKFDIDIAWVDQLAVKDADNIALATERRDVMKKSEWEWQPLPEPMSNRIYPVDPDSSRVHFLERFHTLFAGHEFL